MIVLAFVLYAPILPTAAILHLIELRRWRKAFTAPPQKALTQ